MPAQPSLIVNGWEPYAHTLFFEQYQLLFDKVEKLKEKDPKGYTKKNVTKRFAAIHKLTYDIIPQNPTLPEYRPDSWDALLKFASSLSSSLD